MKENINNAFKEAFAATLLYSKQDKDVLEDFFTFLSKVDVHSMLSTASLENIKRYIYIEKSQNIIFEFLTLLNTRFFINNVTEEILCNICVNNMKIFDSKSIDNTLVKAVVDSNIIKNDKYFEDDIMVVLLYITRLHINNILFQIRGNKTNE